MMLNRLVASAAIAMALLVVAASFDAADARSRGGGRGFHGGSYARAYSGRAFSGHAVHARRFYGGRFVRRGIGVGAIGLPLAYGAYYYGYGYGDGCGWLRHRALVTGSGYWWNRYYACRDGYGY
jgi:hypothetical protein